MLESLCGKAKGHGDSWNRARHQDQHQSLDGLLSSKPFHKLKSTEQEFSGSASQRRSQWLSANCSHGPDPDTASSKHECPPENARQTSFSSPRLSIPHSRSFVLDSRPTSLSMDSRKSPTFLINSEPESISAGPQNREHTSRARTSTRPESRPRGSVSNLGIMRQNTVTSDSASLSPLISSHSRPLKLSAIQKIALQNTWRIIKDNSADRIAEKIFQKLVNQQPKVKDVFYKAAFLTIFSRSNSITTCRDHSRLLVRVISDLVSNLDKSETVMSQIRECGMKHVFLRQSGFKADIWEKFGESAIEVIIEQDCVKSNMEAVKGWTILVASMTDEMRHGFEKEVRRRSYTAERPKSACE